MKSFKEYRDSVVDKILTESFDSPYSLEEIHIPESDMKIIKTHGVEDYKEYSINDNQSDNKKSKLISYKRKGAYEIHHVNSDDVSGEMINGGKPNPRFIATMFHHAKSLVDLGHSVRIVGNKENGMFDHYHRISKALAKKHGFVTSDPKSYADTSSNSEAHRFKEFLVSKNIIENLDTCVLFHSGTSFGPIYDIMKIRTLSRTI